MSGASGHPDADVLADLAEGGLLTPADEAATRAHMAACADCADLLAALSALPDLLADAAAVPVPVPADVAARIDGALAAEAARRAPVVPPPRPQTDPVVTPLRPRPAGRRRRRRPLLLAAAGVAAVVLGAGALVATIGDDGKAGEERSAAAPGQADAQATLDAPEAPAPEGEAPDPEAPAPAPVSSRYTSAALADQVRALLRAPDGTREFGPNTADGPPAAVDRTPSCVARALATLDLDRAGARASATGTYDGVPAYVLVWNTEVAAQVRVVVVARTCPAGADTRVLADTTVAV